MWWRIGMGGVVEDRDRRCGEDRDGKCGGGHE